MMEIDTETVIKKVNARPALWDATSRLYKCREARQAAWTAICTELVDDFFNLDEAQQARIESKIQQRWRTARDCYVKLKSSKATEGQRRCKSYAYADLMTFLDGTVRVPEPASAADADRAGLALRTERRRRYKANKRLQNKITLRQTVQRNDPVISRHDNSTMSLFEKTFLSYLKKDESPLEADDNDFFKSLGPILREFDSGQKLLFRSRVLATALDIQNDIKRSSSATTHSGYLDGEDPDPLVDEPFEKKYRPDEEYEECFEPEIAVEDNSASVAQAGAHRGRGGV